MQDELSFKRCERSNSSLESPYQAVQQIQNDSVASENKKVSVKPKVEYEIINISDTIKRRLESTSTIPDILQTTNEKVVENPSTVKTEIAECPPLEKKEDYIKIDKIGSQKSTQNERLSPENVINNDVIGETFNLSEDSELFSQISDNKLHINKTIEKKGKSSAKVDKCHVVEVRAGEIIKSVLPSIESMEVYHSSAIDTAVEYFPHSVEKVEIATDTETDSDLDEKQSSQNCSQEGLSEWAVLQLSKLDSTVKVSQKKLIMDSFEDTQPKSPEVQKSEETRKPLVGILKRRMNQNNSNDADMKAVKSNQEIKLTMTKIVTVQEEVVHEYLYSDSDEHLDTKTPPSTPYAGIDVSKNPLFEDFESKILDLELKNNASLLKDKESVAEYLILDDSNVGVKKDLNHTKVFNENKKSSGVGISGSVADRISRKSSGIGSLEECEYENESFYSSDKEADDILVFSDDEDTREDKIDADSAQKKQLVVSKPVLNKV